MTILLGPLRYRDQLKAAHPDAIGGEMEGSGIYAAAMRGKIDWALVKGICDWGHGKSDEYQHVAAQNAASFVLHTPRRSAASGPCPLILDTGVMQPGAA